MYLRKICIQGFKSFPDLTEIDTHGGITCIVGPNGCGKSNIADAVRWVLGEQNPRRLRGRAMSDMIFAGTASRKPEGLAEVTLVLDNSTGYFSSPYTELAITRELYGNGDSFYKINGKRVRLLDVQELFLDRGVGLDNYSMIEQGQVARLMDSRPEDRRAIIEEAAGIVMFQLRREKCERKLRRVELDLERLRDILNELERQARSLRQQAARAKRYKELHARLRAIELVRYGEEYAGRKAHLDELSAELSALLEQSEQTDARRTALAADLEAAELAQTQAEHVLAGLRDQRLSLDGEITGISQRIALYQRQETEQHQRLEQIAAEREQIVQRMAELAQEDTALHARVHELTGDVETLRAQVADLETQAETLRQTAGQHQHAHNEAREAAFRAESQITALQNEQHQIERETAAAQNRRQRLLSNQESVQQDAERVRQEISALHLRLEEHRTDRVGASCEKTHTEGTLSDVQQRLDAAEAELAGIVGALQSKRVRLESLQTLQRNFEGYRKAVIDILQRRRAGDETLQAVLGTVASQVRVAREHAKAIEAALGEGLQTLVAESGAPVAEIIAASTGSGRLSMVCVDRIRSNGIPALPEGLPFAAVRASTLVQADAPFDRVVSALLDGVYVVDDIGPCLAAAEQIPTGVRFVTRVGILFDVRGVLSGGDGEGAGILARQREIEELQEEVAALDGQRTQVEQACAGLSAERHALRQRLQALTDQQYQIDIQLATAQKELAALLRDSDRLASEQERLKEEIAALDEDMSRLDAARRTTLEAQEEAARRRDALAVRVAETGEALRAANTARDEGVARLGTARVTLGERTKDLQMAQREQQRCADTAAELENRLAALATMQEQVQEALRNTAHERNALEQRLQELYVQSEQLARSLNDAQYVLAEKTEQRDAVRATLNAIHNERETLRSAITERELAATREQVELTALLRRLHDAYQLTIDEANAARQDVQPDEGRNLEETAVELRERLARMGAINECALEDYERVSAELEFKSAQVQDLEKARENLLKTIREVRKTTRDLFLETFDKVRENFRQMFRKVFGGGRADLVLLTSDEIDVMEAGVEIIAQPPGKNLQAISLLSGGERAMTAIALIFSLYQIKPSPFCFLDEIDAPLDDVNVGRFCALVREFTGRTQFVIVTHNKRTMEMADRIYGVTMQKEGQSSIVSIDFETHRDGRSAPRLRMTGLDEPATGTNGNGHGDGEALVEAALEEVVPDTVTGLDTPGPLAAPPRNGHVHHDSPGGMDSETHAAPAVTENPGSDHVAVGDERAR